MMMEENSRLTKVVAENQNHFQCYYNNVGYCKFRDQCRHRHFTDICQKVICRDKKCQSRHPRTCKYGESCKFLSRNCCVYSHKSVHSDKIDDREKMEAIKLKNEVEELKLEIAGLNKELEEKNMKILELSEVITNQNKIISELKTENSSIISKLSEIQFDLKENSKLIQSKDDIINAKNDEISRLKGDFKCDKCQFCTSNLTLLIKHKTSEHRLK